MSTDFRGDLALLGLALSAPGEDRLEGQRSYSQYSGSPLSNLVADVLGVVPLGPKDVRRVPLGFLGGLLDLLRGLGG